LLVLVTPVKVKPLVRTKPQQPKLRHSFSLIVHVIIECEIFLLVNSSTSLVLVLLLLILLLD